MGKVISFEEKSEQLKTAEILEGIRFPSEKEIEELNAITESYRDKNTLPIDSWNGECWEIFYLDVHNKAMRESLSDWDCMAVIINKIFKKMRGEHI